jgi:peptidoglycan/xylan/chitin deacetylase (PgdA/CDA1 family)
MMRSIPILTYHQIEEAPPKGAAMRSLYVSPRAFARQMRLLKMLGYQGLGMSALEPYLRGEREGRVVGITFDDGYVNNLTHAAPVLKACGFSATCYVVSDLIGQTNRWDASLGVKSAPLMNRAQLKEWTQMGLEIGSHTLSHSSFLKIEPEQVRREITLSKAHLEEILGGEIRQFCYPYGHYLPEHARWVGEAGYWAATTTQRGRVKPGHGANAASEEATRGGTYQFELPRVPVVRSSSWLQFLLKVATSYEDRKHHEGQH